MLQVEQNAGKLIQKDMGITNGTVTAWSNMYLFLSHIHARIQTLAT